MQDWPPLLDASGVHAGERFVLHGAGSPVPADELEHAARLALELVVLWQGDVLTVRHCSLPGAFWVGEADSACDLALPVALLEAPRLCVAVASRNEIQAVIPARARAWLSLPDGTVRPLESRPAAVADTERLVPLGLGYRVHLRFSDIELQVAAVAAGKAPRRLRSRGFDGALLPCFVLAALAVAAVLLTLSALAPPLGLTPDEQVTSQRMYLLRSYLEAAAERELKPKPAVDDSKRPAAARPTLPPSRYEAPPRLQREVRTSQRPAEPQLQADDGEPRSTPSRKAAIQEAESFGIIALLGEHLQTLRDERLPFTRELGSDDVALMQQMYNGEPSWDEGPGGLALSGTGRRGGGTAEVVQLEARSTIAHGKGTLPESHVYLGSPSGSHRPNTPSEPAPGAMLQAAIRDTLRAHAARLQACHPPEGAASAGKSILRFAVKPGGRAAQLRVAGTPLASDVVRCLEGIITTLSFPSSSEAVSVTYPLQLGR
ncbi:MAG: hypothetical protein RL033_5238 [Pseudomonadota bacterium]